MYYFSDLVKFLARHERITPVKVHISREDITRYHTPTPQKTKKHTQYHHCHSIKCIQLYTHTTILSKNR